MSEFDESSNRNEQGRAVGFASALMPHLEQLRGLRDSAIALVPIALTKHIEQLRTTIDTFKRLLDEVNRLQDSNKDLPASMVDEILSVTRRADRTHQEPSETLLRSLFIGSFAVFDAFMGELLSTAFRVRPELLGALSGASVSVSDILLASSLEDCRTSIISKEIDSIRRESYPEQFDRLEKLFGVTLRKFNRWPDFVEAGQRRNLITHCNGIVSTQYLTVCAREKVPLSEALSVGQKLSVTPKYFVSATTLLMEVAVKLTHTVWRKVLPSELDKADEHLHSLVYEALHFEEWNWAARLGEFGIDLPRHSSELHERIMTVNLAIAYARGGQRPRAVKLLASRDWSAASGEFKLAVHVLNEQFGDAIAAMKDMGCAGSLLTEVSYYTWPLFSDFRARPEFAPVFEEIYGHPFAKEVRRQLEIASASSASEMARASEAG